MGKKVKGLKRLLFWLAVAITNYLFVRIAQGLYENGVSETRYLVGLIYFGWVSVMLK